MGINWNTGEITAEQHVLQPEQLTPMAKDMELGQIAYMDADELGASLDGKLWIKQHAALYSEDEVPKVSEANEGLYFCRLIRIDQGYVVDASAGDYKLNRFEPKDTVPVAADFDPEEEGWIPVVGLAGTDLERYALGEMLFDKHNILLGKSVLLSLEPSSDDRSGGDGLTP
jgi:hypothetical protein